MRLIVFVRSNCENSLSADMLKVQVRKAVPDLGPSYLNLRRAT